MNILTVPELEPVDGRFPSLGPQIVDWMQQNLVHGPGDVRGEPYRLDREKKGIIYRLYEVFPQGHPQEGRRRFKRGAISVRKGWAKTELGAAIVAAELHPDAPVRCLGFEDDGTPIGEGVRDPYIPMVAYTEEQSEELAYGALLVMLGEGPLSDDFDLGLERIIVIGEDGRPAGKAVALATAPDSRDGARTTFQLFDETHRLALPRLKEAHQTMQANLPKRKKADAWSLEVTTSFAPGEGSVAEGTHNYAKLVADGKISDSRLFFYHRQATDLHDLTTPEGMRAAVVEASGPAAEWTDIDGIVELGLDPQTDRRYWERVWLNRIVIGSDQAFDVLRWDELTDNDHKDWKPPAGELITLGFDGSRTNDATAIVGTHVPTKRQFVIGVWERPRSSPPDWEVPVEEVDQAMDAAFQRWDVAAAYCDPYWWETWVSNWTGRFGKRRGRMRVIEWHTNRPKTMAYALRAFSGAIRAGEVTHDGNETLRSHLGNARRHELNIYDQDDQRLWVIRKERVDSPFKIDAAMAACLSWEALRDVVSVGVKSRSRVVRQF